MRLRGLGGEGLVFILQRYLNVVLLVFAKYSAMHYCMALHVWFRISAVFSFMFGWHKQIVLFEGKNNCVSTATKISDFKKLFISNCNKRLLF